MPGINKFLLNEMSVSTPTTQSLAGEAEEKTLPESPALTVESGFLLGVLKQEGKPHMLRSWDQAAVAAQALCEVPHLGQPLRMQADREILEPGPGRQPGAGSLASFLVSVLALAAHGILRVGFLRQTWCRAGRGFGHMRKAGSPKAPL